MSSKIDTVIFDLGGVLVDWDPRNLYKKIFDTQEEVDWFLANVCTSAWNLKQDEGCTIAQANADKIKEFPQFEKEILQFYERWSEMFSGAFQENVAIQQSLIANPNYKVYALTNWSAEKWEEGKKLFPFFNDFKDVIVSGQENMRKPTNEIYQLTIERFGIIPENTVFIDDNLENTLASTKHGIQGIHYVYPDQLLEKLNKWGVLVDI